MSAPLVSTDLATALQAGPILVVERQEAEVRDTVEHAHAAGQLIGSLAGLLSISSPGESWIVPATHAIWMPPHLPHAMRSHGPFKGWSVYVSEEASAHLPGKPRTLRISALLREVLHRSAGWGRPPNSKAEHRLAVVLLDEINTLPIEPLGLPYPADPRVRRIADAILDDLADQRPLNAWAKWGGITPRTLARRFVGETGFGFSEWRQRARTLRSIELLARGVPVTTVAIDMGYENVSAFIAMFRRTMGMTPGAYARSQAILPDNEGCRMNGTTTYQTRWATRDDLPALKAVMQHAIDALQTGLLSPEQVAASHAIMGLDTQLVDDGTYLIAERDGVVAGCGGWSKRATLYGGDHSTDLRDPELLDPASDPAKIRAMYTNPDFARQGVGRLILQGCEDAAAEHGFAAVELMATLSGERLYAASGYVAIENVEAVANGIAIPLIRMRKALPPQRPTSTAQA